MRRALSTYLFVERRLTTSLLDRVLRSGIDEVELFCARQHLDYRNSSQIDELRHWFDDSEMRVHSLHAPLFSDDVWGRSGPHAIVSLTEPDKAKRIRVTDEIKRALEIADSIPFRYLIVHLGQAEEEYHPLKFEAAFKALDELIVFGRGLGVDILLENTPNELSSAARLNSFLALTHLKLGYCFDVGHAHLEGGVESEFEKMKDRIRSTHVHDNDQALDSHLFPPDAEDGSIDWEKTMELLRSLDEGPPLLLELHGDPEMEDPLGAARRSFERLESI